jgi:general secretion pathway protein H
MKSARGLSLIEVLVVVALIAVIAGLAASVMGRALPGQQLRGAAREIAGQLRFTRAQAIATGREQTFRVDVIERRWQAAGQREGQVPEELELIATTARQPQAQAATGGRFVLKRGNAAWRIDVAWLTGEVTLSRGEGPP